MATFYLDHDLKDEVKAALEARRHVAIRTRELGMDRADDATQLFRAAQAGRILVTHNERDFKLLQSAWRLWPAPLLHAGILVIRHQHWTPAQIGDELDLVIRSGWPLANELYWWTPSRGWLRYG